MQIGQQPALDWTGPYGSGCHTQYCDYAPEPQFRFCPLVKIRASRCPSCSPTSAWPRATAVPMSCIKQQRLGIGPATGSSSPSCRQSGLIDSLPTPPW
jgi:hypothetical protein